jgi:HEAT repeat protein
VKRLVVGDLESAVYDSDEGVRNNAIRALGAIADLAARKPELGIHISPGPFVDLLNSPFWTDRNKATFVLGGLTDGGDPATLAALRERALPALVEMARWKSPGHALGPFVLLGRVVGLSDRESKEAFQRGDREVVIARALRSAAGRRQ